MSDRVEVGARRRVGERHLSETTPIQGSVAVEYLRSEPLDEGGEGGLAGFDNLASDPVRVDEDRTPVDE